MLRFDGREEPDEDGGGEVVDRLTTVVASLHGGGGGGGEPVILACCSATARWTTAADRAGRCCVLQEEVRYGCRAAFVAIGHDPNTGLFKGQLEMARDGYLDLGPHPFT